MVELALRPETDSVANAVSADDTRDFTKDPTSALCSTHDFQIAKHLEGLLILYEFRTAVIQRDPLGVGMAVVELLVFSSDREKAIRILENEKSNATLKSWQCNACGAVVPGHFDICWNCCEAHSSSGLSYISETSQRFNHVR